MRDRESNSAVGVVVVAAGSASRMQGIDKMLYELEGMPVCARSIRAVSAPDCVLEVAVVCRAGDIAALWDMQRFFALDKVRTIVAGGATRQESVFAGVRALSPACSLVAIHDGARPFVDGAAIEAAVACAARTGAAAAAVPVKDTIKVADSEGRIESTPPRERLYIAQTPQVFDRALYHEAMEAAAREGLDFTDDCQLIEHLGRRVTLTMGSYLNFKITTPEDLILAQAVAAGEVY